MASGREDGRGRKDWQSLGKWKDGRVRSGAKVTIWISLLFGIAFTGAGIPLAMQMPQEIADENYIILLALLFPLIGLSSLVLFVRSVLAWRKFGRTELVLDPVPGSIGGDFGGYVDLPIAGSSARNQNIDVDLVLNCLQTTTTGSGKNRSTRTKVVWQREGLATVALTRDGIRCAFRFAIPDDLPETEASSSSYNHWLFQIECDLPGIDFKRSFNVPLIRHESPQFSNLRAAYAQASNPLKKPPKGSVDITESTDGLQFYYPWHRHLKMAISLFIFGSIFAVIGYFIGAYDGGLVFPVVFGGVGILTVIASLYVIGNTLTTRVGRDGIDVVRNVYGFRFKKKVTRDNIVGLERQIASQMQSAGDYSVYYTIVAHSKDGREITIADSLEGSRLTDFVENKVKAALRLDDAVSLVDSWGT
ncbi:MAG: hypothetical protein IMF14_04355 [Proteobacteria bacterium]|nr:hypothetical protein [Pseudomonadota bacterium]